MTLEGNILNIYDIEYSVLNFVKIADLELFPLPTL